MGWNGFPGIFNFRALSQADVYPFEMCRFHFVQRTLLQLDHCFFQVCYVVFSGKFTPINYLIARK